MRLVFTFNPKGLNCQHVQVCDVQGKVIVGTDTNEMKEPVSSHDGDIMKQIKQRSVGVNLLDSVIAKVALEREEYDV